MEYHNFVLEHYFKVAPVDYQQVLQTALAHGEQLKPLVADTPKVLHDLHVNNANILFEGAQGVLLDIDHGTYPFVTSSNTTAGGAATGSGVGPLNFNAILGIAKAYTTRVGAGPFPTELFDAIGEHIGSKGQEFGATTGRKRRCGWLDMVALRRAVQVSSISSLAITKLDVLDTLNQLRICVAYRLDGKELDTPPLDTEDMSRCEPVFIDLPGWQESTVGVRDYQTLPINARAYLRTIEELSGCPIDIISTGAERDETIVLQHPFVS
jgi:adenylosuccinate synthase